jgi:hypothetical protein
MLLKTGHMVVLVETDQMVVRWLWPHVGCLMVRWLYKYFIDSTDDYTYTGVMVDGLPVEIPLDIQLVLLLLPGICKSVVFSHSWLAERTWELWDPEAGVLKKLSLAGLALLSRLRYS